MPCSASSLTSTIADTAAWLAARDNGGAWKHVLGDDRERALAAGFQLHLAKPVDPCELRARILVGKRILDLQQCLRFSATHDFLTNLLSRAEILASLERELVRTQREGRPAGVIMADVDGFKQINDRFGHLEGNRVLKLFAQRLKESCREYDYVARMGGDEFCVVLEGVVSVEEVERRDRAVALGTFDGVHLGHRRVLETAMGAGLTTTVVTFHPHPRRVLGYGVELLTTLERRLELLAEAGVEETLVVGFTLELAGMEPDAFVDELLRPIAYALPKLTKTAGFEWGTGFYINPTPPEEAAKFLREANIEETAAVPIG